MPSTLTVEVATLQYFGEVTPTQAAPKPAVSGATQDELQKYRNTYTGYKGPSLRRAFLSQAPSPAHRRLCKGIWREGGGALSPRLGIKQRPVSTLPPARAAAPPQPGTPPLPRPLTLTWKHRGPARPLTLGTERGGSVRASSERAGPAPPTYPGRGGEAAAAPGPGEPPVPSPFAKRPLVPLPRTALGSGSVGSATPVPSAEAHFGTTHPSPLVQSTRVPAALAGAASPLPPLSVRAGRSRLPRDVTSEEPD